MSLTLTTLLYLSLGLALSYLRLDQGWRWGDALFGGLFWPLDWGARGIKVMADSILE